MWGAATVSTFGSLVTRTALPFTAILLLDASPSAISVLRVAELLPGFIFGLVAGAWVDRLRRKRIMIATDGRALLIVTIPGRVPGWLGLGQLYVIAALVSVLSVFFDVAYQSLLPHSSRTTSWSKPTVNSARRCRSPRRARSVPPDG